MNENAPGMSIFQGENVCPQSDMNEEENDEDEYEDNQRRQAELANELENAFDDLIDGDDDNESLQYVEPVAVKPPPPAKCLEASDAVEGCSKNSSMALEQRRRMLELRQQAFMNNVQVDSRQAFHQQFPTDQRNQSHGQMDHRDPRWSPQPTANDCEIRRADVSTDIRRKQFAMDARDTRTSSRSPEMRDMRLGQRSPDHNLRRVSRDLAREECEFRSPGMTEDRNNHGRSHGAMDERQAYETHISELKKRLTVAEAERDRENATRKQTHELLVEAKTKISDLEEIVNAEKLKNSQLEKSKLSLMGQLENTKAMLEDMQRKYCLVKCDLGFQKDRSSDAAIKAINERHNAQIVVMQQQIESLTNRLEAKSNECNQFETRYTELHRSQEALLVEKTASINDLASNLEECQRRCQNFMCRPKTPDKSSPKCDPRDAQIEDQRKKISALTSKLNQTLVELDLMDMILTENEVSKTVRRASITQRQVTPSLALISDTEGRFANLKTELYRCVANLKLKREQIKFLEKSLAQQTTEIQRLQSEADVNMLRNKSTSIYGKLQTCEQELKEAQGLKCIVSKLEAELASTKDKLQKNNSELDTVKNLYVKLSNSKKDWKNSTRNRPNTIEREISEINVSAVMAAEKVNSCTQCAKHEAEAARLENQNVQLQNTSGAYLNEIKELRSAAVKQSSKISNLNRILEEKSNEEGSVDMGLPLGTPREQMRMNSENACNRSLQDSSQERENQMQWDQSVSTSLRNTSQAGQALPASNEASQGKANNADCKRLQRSPPGTEISPSARTLDSASRRNESQQEIENRVRQEFAQSFAVQLTQIEEQYREDLDKCGEIMAVLREELGVLQDTLQGRENDVRTLKKVVIEERKRYAELLVKKDGEINNAEDQIEKYQENMEIFQKKILLYKRQIRDLQKTIEDDRTQLKNVGDFTVEREKLQSSIRQYAAQLEKLKEAHMAETKELSSKLECAKTTVVNHKKFFADKEQHMLNEYARIKEGYKERAEELNDKMRSIIAKRDADHNMKIKDLEDKLRQYGNQ